MSSSSAIHRHIRPSPHPDYSDTISPFAVVPGFHFLSVGPNQCHSTLVQQINAPVRTVWSLVRQFQNPQSYKRFVDSCERLAEGLRRVHIVSGLPASSSTERLDILDDDRHVFGFSMVVGSADIDPEHRLRNYRSITALHPTADGLHTVVVESYVVDTPAGNTKDDTCVFVDTIVGFNLKSLARVAENLAAANHQINQACEI